MIRQRRIDSRHRPSYGGKNCKLQYTLRNSMSLQQCAGRPPVRISPFRPTREFALNIFPAGYTYMITLYTSCF
ncbi:unnamed protein product [Euphydryas editha]|uniref:Uncharacterized protein n=1 Tax=Euphydryas editha TaxID=104508 RepID=A0AAU9UBZ9_EUPED|nr:unnamed protein product [Euphydryas editha]